MKYEDLLPKASYSLKIPSVAGVIKGLSWTVKEYPSLLSANPIIERPVPR